jgi:hypothetical protein
MNGAVGPLAQVNDLGSRCVLSCYSLPHADGLEVPRSALLGWVLLFVVYM